MKKKILITGSRGLIGSSILKEIPKKKYKIFEIDSKISKYHSIERKSINKKLNKIKPDIIVHCAAHPGGLSMKQPFKNISINLIGTFRLIDWCRKNNNKIIFLSSSAVYGNQKKKKLTENSILNPGTVYGINKVACENYIKELSKYSNFKWLIIRLFATYGEQHSPNLYQGIINIILTQLKYKKKLIIKGPLNRKRDLIYSKDAAKIIIKLINRNVENKIINVGTGKATTIKTIISICRKLLSINNNKTIVEKKTPGDPMFAVANISLLKTYIGNYNFVSIKKGIEKTIRKFQKK